MSIYRFDPLEKYECAVPIDTDEYEILASLGGSSRLNDWKPVSMKRLTEDDHGRPLRQSDFPSMGLYIPLFRRRAADALRDFLAPFGELLPLDYTDGELFVLNVTRVIDALDMERSDVVMFPGGTDIMMVRRFVFRPEVVHGVHVFKVPQIETVFVDEEFVDLVKQSGLEGAGFKRLWTYELDHVSDTNSAR